MSRQYHIAVIGGGIVGCATAMALAARPGVSLVLLEAEENLGQHQTGHNSGVIHAGLYYSPGSQKARLCVEGRQALERFCEQRGIPYERCGKLVVATDPKELPRLEELERRGRANGLEGIRRLGPEELREREPHVAAVEGLWVPQTGIVDYEIVTRALAEEAQRGGAQIMTSARVQGLQREPGGLVLETSRGAVRCRQLINCAGLQSDRVARCCGLDPGLSILPFRGEYYEVLPRGRSLVRNLIYPVPDPRFPFLGVHFTRRVSGGLEAGPNAVLALRREGYRGWSFSLRDSLEILGYRGFWRMAARYWRMGLGEIWRSSSKRAFHHSLCRLVPDLPIRDLKRGSSGVRAQAVDPQGRLLDDFCIIEGTDMLHVLNAPSPAATASISIGRFIAARAREAFG